MCSYDIQHSNRQIKKSPISFGGRFAKFNARQSFSLYGTFILYFKQAPLVLWLFKILFSLGEWAVKVFFVVSETILE